jgi:predicted DCC family thiol-disulfide oxidoreductase YuxK
VNKRPVLIYDGDCSFCKLWIGYWGALTGDRVEYITAAAAAAKSRYSDIPVLDMRRSVQFIAPDGTRYQAAEAVFRSLATVPRLGWLLVLYHSLPGFSMIAEAIYRLIARNRELGYKVTRLLWGDEVRPSTYFAASALFTRALSFLYLIAFASFGMQARGLIGSQGILPLRSYFESALGQLGSSTLWRIPTLFWWAPEDFAILSIAWGGVALSAFSLLARPFSKWQRMIFVLLFAYHLSIVSAGQTFYLFQWDLLLLECGFLAIFIRPTGMRNWLFRWLLFRFMLEAGVVKLSSGDPAWRNLTALSFHYQTQPLPTVIAWLIYKAPLWFHRTCTFVTLAIELALPICIFLPRRAKQLAGIGFLLLQVLIFLTGNYNIFNLLTMAMCLFLFDDAALKRFRKAAPETAPRAAFAITALLATLLLTVSAAQLIGMAGVEIPAVAEYADITAPFGIVNEYGLFAVMTTKRPEIEVEGTLDGTNWKPYTFRYKPGPLNRMPGWIAPFQPRLDWQMWFAALGSYRENPWFVRFLICLLEGSKPVLALLDGDPFDGQRPIRVRATIYEYRFTTFSEWRATGNWWVRERIGDYFPPIGLKQGS